MNLKQTQNNDLMGINGSPRPSPERTTINNGNNTARKGIRMQHDGSMIKTATNDGAYHNPYSNLVDDPAVAIAKVSSLEKDMERRQETYVARERAYKSRIEELEEEISLLKQNKTGWMSKDGKISKLRQMQSQIMSNIELVQDRTARILQEQERDLLKAFRARLYDVQTELEKEKCKKDDGAGAWIDKCNTLTSELEWSKSVADRLERVNQSLMQDNSRLRSEFVSQEEDRNFVITQLVTVKKENAKLRAEFTALEAEYNALRQRMDKIADDSASKNSSILGRSGLTNSNNLNGLNNNNNNSNSNSANRYESDEKYKEINARLKRLLLDERKSLQSLRQTYANELKSRSDLELLLRQCVEDVRKEIARKKIESGLLPSSSDVARLYNRLPGMIQVDEFTSQDRERVLELLLSQERVITMLYAKTFPIGGKSNGTAGSNNGLDSTSHHHAGLHHNVSFGGHDDLNNNTNRSGSGLGHGYGGDIDNDMNIDLGDSRPQSSKLLGTPGERDRERDKVKLPSIHSLSNNVSNNNLIVAPLSRPSTGSK